MFKYKSPKRGFKGLGKLDEIQAEEAEINNSPEVIAVNAVAGHALDQMYANLLLCGSHKWQVKRLETPYEP